MRGLIKHLCYLLDTAGFVSRAVKKSGLVPVGKRANPQRKARSAYMPSSTVSGMAFASRSIFAM